MMEYRAGTIIAVAASTLAQITAIIFINVLFSKMPHFYNWSYFDLLLLFGIAITSRALTQVFLNMPYFIPGFIRRGVLDVLLIRPVSPLFQAIGMSQEVNAFGTLITGIFVIIYAGIHSSITWSAFKIFYLIIALASSMLIQFSFLLAAVIPSFWIIDSSSLIYPFGWLMDFLRYPLEIFPNFLRFTLTYIIPYSLGSYFPALFLINPEKYLWTVWVIPLTGVAALIAVLFFWRIGLRHYSSSG